MARLKAVEQAYFIQLFVKNGCDIYCFSDTEKFDEFCKPIIGFKPAKKYGHYLVSKSFEDLLRTEDSTIVIPLMDELFGFCEVSDKFFGLFKEELKIKCKEIITKYSKISGIKNLEVKFNSEYIDTCEKEMCENIVKNPTEAIGQAKDFIETCCKSILESENIAINKNWDISNLVDETLKILELLPSSVNNQEEYSKDVKAILGNLRAIPTFLSRFRNEYGSGHGKNKNFRSLESRHAKLAVGSSITFVGFVWETYNQAKK